MSIKTIIGNIFISPLTDIIYEYAKCYYCNHVKQKILSLLKEKDEIKFEFPFISSAYVLIRISKSQKYDELHLYTLYDDRQEAFGTNILVSFDQLAYIVAHLDIFESHDINILNHTDMPPNMDYPKREFLKYVGIDTNIFVHNKK